MVYTYMEYLCQELRNMDAQDIVQGIELVKANPWIIAVAVVVLLSVFFMIFKTSLKVAFKVLINAAVGFVLLFVFNGLGSVIGVTLEVNWLNVIVSGILGIPGIALLLIAQWLGII